MIEIPANHKNISFAKTHGATKPIVGPERMRFKPAWGVYFNPRKPPRAETVRFIYRNWRAHVVVKTVIRVDHIGFR